MRWNHALTVAACCGGWVSATTAQPVPPNPLQSAYWRFEQGPADTLVPFGTDTVLDSLGGNHMRRWIEDFAAPTYTTQVPAAFVPQTGEPNTLALNFTPNRDLYSEGKPINNPVAAAFTIELAMRPGLVSFPNGPYQAVFGKDGKPLAASPLQTLVLKVRGDDGTLQWEWFDKSGAEHNLRSTAPLEAEKWYYVAAVADSTTARLYLDRNDGNGYVLQGEVAVTDGPIWQGTDPAVGDDWAWTIGRGMYNGGVTDWFNGIIDEVRITNEALTPEEFLFTANVPPLLGDFDRDKDVDLDDLLEFTDCTTGPAIPYDPLNLPPACDLQPDNDGYIPPDFDRDGDVDQEDFGVFQVSYTG